MRELNYRNEAAIKWVTDPVIKKLRGENHEIRLLPPKHEFGFSDFIIVGDTVSIFSLKGEPFVVTLTSPEIAKTLKAVFEWLWEAGEKV